MATIERWNLPPVCLIPGRYNSRHLMRRSYYLQQAAETDTSPDLIDIKVTTEVEGEGESEAGSTIVRSHKIGSDLA